MTTLIIAAHPDDEILGAGGTMAKLSAAGEDVHIVIMAEGATSRTAERNRDEASQQLSELGRCAHAAGAIVGAKSVQLEQFPDNRMDGVDLLDVVKCVEGHIGRTVPQTVFTHHSSDVNIDHRVVHDAVIAAVRPQPDYPVKRLFFFEVMSATEWRPGASMPPFAPNYFVDITSSLSSKLDALRAYAPEMRDWPHARSIEALEHLAHLRGATIGAHAAEAFSVGRILG